MCVLKIQFCSGTNENVRSNTTTTAAAPQQQQQHNMLHSKIWACTPIIDTMHAIIMLTTLILNRR